MTQPKIEMTIPLEDLQKLMQDVQIQAIVDKCNVDSPQAVGECSEEAILARIIEIYGEEARAAQSMVEWYANDPNSNDPDKCRSCVLPVTLQWYCDELKEMGEKRLAADLETVGQQQTPEDVVREMDRIKGVVVDTLRVRLTEFDATTQVNSE